MPKVLLFANPIAGRGSAMGLGRSLADRLTGEGYRCELLHDRPDTIDPMTLCEREVRCIVVIGGDGTLRAVAGRMVDHCPREDWPPLLVVPMGTANLMGKHLGIRWDPRHAAEQVAAAIRRRRIVSLDAARANGRLFLLMAGVGVDAQIVHEVDRRRRGPIRKSSYLWPAARVVGGYDFPSITVHADGRLIFGPRPGVAFVGNISEYGTGFPMLPRARPDDGVLDVCALPCGSRLQMMKLFLHAAAGEHAQQEGSACVKARLVQIESDRPVAVQVDGEPAGFTPVRLEMMERKLDFVVE
jgi:YegS/Rv2252/BmrU family lipid kinase